MTTNQALAESLSSSRIYLDYERSFTETTGLPLVFRPVESWQLPHHNRKNENRFCSFMALKSRSCASCLQVQQKLAARAKDGTHSVACPHGMCDSAVPVRLGEKLIGFLQTGQVFRRKPTPAMFERSARLAAEWGLNLSRSQLKEAFYSGRVFPTRQYAAALKMLEIFAQHLSMVSNQVLMQQASAESPMVIRAKEYIQQHQAEDLTLSQVSKVVNTSSFYFCKVFKKGTGLNFTDYLCRLRIERAKNLLLNPNLRVSEIAYEIGFQSLTHFNRVFKRVLGEPPTEFRARLANV